MLALLYILASLYLGDCICRRFYRFSSAQHRWATAFLVGLLLSSWVTYLSALCFSWTGHALLCGNLAFLAAVILTARCLPPGVGSDYLDAVMPRPPGSNSYDWLCLASCFVLGCWLMLATLNWHDGSFVFAFKSWSDFGANLALAQSFVLGDNFPSEHPFFRDALRDTASPYRAWFRWSPTKPAELNPWGQSNWRKSPRYGTVRP